MLKINKNQIEKVITFIGQHSSNFTVIGGIAVDFVLKDTPIVPRTTKDIDIVLCTDNLDGDFNKDLVKFLKAGKYKNALINKKKCAYRFIHPDNEEYPNIVELFAKEDKISKELHHYLGKINIEYDNELLSAILIDEEIYNFIVEHKIIIDSLPVDDCSALIALKTYAYFNNQKLKEEGKITSDHDISKHRSDIIRMLASIGEIPTAIELPNILKKSVKEFEKVLLNSTRVAKDIGITNANLTIEKLLEVYRRLWK
ncbi:MAG: hypothetical protein MJ213_05780 [Bacilli bacterium]|nr:hypothetical protein [Bacilli bacterium]